MTKNSDLPTTLRALRARLALTQEQLADRLSVSFATVNRWEAGASKPQRAQAQAIAALTAASGMEPETAELGTPAIVSRRGRRAAAATPTTKPMEQMLWDAACSIRGEKDAAKFKEVYASFTVSNQVRRASQLQDAYGVEGVPSMGVAGRYYTDGTMAGSLENVLRVVDQLAEQARKG